MTSFGKWTLAVVMIVAGALPGWAEEQVTEHSPNVRELDGGFMEWPPPKNPNAGGRWLQEAAFSGRLMITSIQGGNAADAYSPNDVGESGIGIFRVSRDGSTATHLGTLRCHSFPFVNAWGSLVFQGTAETTQTGMTGNPEDPCDQDGLRIIDISDPVQPRVARIIDVNCGVATHALMSTGKRLYVYAPNTCREETDNPSATGLSEITVFRVFPDRPRASRIVRTESLLPMAACDEFVIHADRRIAACAGDGRLALYDLSDPAAPTYIEGSLMTVTPSALGMARLAFSLDGSLLAWGNGAYQQKRTGEELSVRLFDIEDVSNPVEAGQWRAPVTPGSDGAVRSLSFVPMKDGRQVLSIAHLNRGFHLLDVTDASDPRSIAYYYGMDTKVGYENEGSLPSKIQAAHWYNGAFYLVESKGRIRILRVDGFNRNTVHYFRAGFNPLTVQADFV